jgi:polysaccharide biosynthesis transport protein
MSIPNQHPSSEPGSPTDAHGRHRTASKSRPGLFKRTPRDFVDMFTERWWIGAIAGGIASALIVFFRPHFEPLYRTETTLQFETRKSNIVPIQPVEDRTLQGAGELAVHIEQLRSNTYLLYVTSTFTAEEQDIILKHYTDPAHPEAKPPLQKIVRDAVSVSPKRTTPILVISVTHRSPEAAQLISDRFARKYIDYQLDNSANKTNSAIRFLGAQADELREQLNLQTTASLNFRKEHSLNSLSESQTITGGLLNTLAGQIITAQAEQIQAKTLIDSVDEYILKKRNLLDLPQIITAGDVALTSSNLTALQSQRNLWEKEYDEELPKMKELDGRIAEEKRRLDESVKKAIQALRARYEQSELVLKNLTEQQKARQLEARDLDKIATEFKSLEEARALTERQYQAMKARYEEAKIAAQLADTNIQVLDPAWVPSAPSDTGVTAIAMKASTAGFGLLLFIPLAIGLFDTRIRTPMHIEEGLQEPLLGAVKRMRKMGETQRAQVFRLQKEKDLAEAYLGIFSEIEVRSTLGFPKTLMVTSSVPAEGKSLLCSNLAAVFASHKRRTLLVDCDLRRPTLHRYFGVKVDTGWVQWLETPPASRPANPLGIVAVSDELHLLPAGRTPGNPTELLDRLSRRETLQPLLQNYDIVIFDTPPAAVFPDALLLARSCHEMIYVCRYRTVRLSVVRKVLERFHDSGVSTLGIVLNQLPETKARNYGYHGYGMQSAEYYKAYAEKPEA